MSDKTSDGEIAGKATQRTSINIIKIGRHQAPAGLFPESI